MAALWAAMTVGSLAGRKDGTMVVAMAQILVVSMAYSKDTWKAAAKVLSKEFAKA